MTKTDTDTTIDRPFVRIDHDVARGDVLTVVASPEGVPPYTLAYTLPGAKVRSDEWVRYSLFADDDPVTVGFDDDGPYVGTERGTLRGARDYHRGILITQEGITHREYRIRKGYQPREAA